MTRYRVPTSVSAAFDQDKAQAIKGRRLSVERLADLHATKPATLYKWMEDGTMPVLHLAGWFHNTGGKGVIRLLCAQAGGLFIEIPSGRRASATDVNDLQGVLTDAVRALLDFHAGRADREGCMAALMGGLEALAWHRENVRKADQPDLEFGA